MSVLRNNPPPPPWDGPSGERRLEDAIHKMAPRNRAPLPITVEKTEYFTRSYSPEDLHRPRTREPGEVLWFVDLHVRTNPEPDDPEPEPHELPGSHDFSVTGVGPTEAAARANAHRNLQRTATLILQGGSPIDKFVSRAASAARRTH